MFIDCYCLAKPRMVEINATKSTLVAKKIAISYSNEDDFLVINNVIQILSLLKINATFEKIDIHHDNYLKNIKTGISEENLTFLKKNGIFIHTPFDMKYFSKENGDIDLKYYLNYALHCCFSLNFCSNGGVFYEMTNFFEKHKSFLVNQQDIIDKILEIKSFLCKQLDKTNIEIFNNDTNADIWYTIYFGEKHIIFDLKNTNDLVIIDFLKTFLVYYGLEQYLVYFEGQTSLKNIIAKLKEINKARMIITTKQLIDFCMTNDKHENVFFLEYSNDEIKRCKEMIPNNITAMKTTFNGLFVVKELVEDFKIRKIKIPEDTRLYKIISNDIEIYPDINFWDDVVVDPIILLVKCDY